MKDFFQNIKTGYSGLTENIDNDYFLQDFLNNKSYFFPLYCLILSLELVCRQSQEGNISEATYSVNRKIYIIKKITFAHWFNILEFPQYRQYRHTNRNLPKFKIWVAFHFVSRKAPIFCNIRNTRTNFSQQNYNSKSNRCFNHLF